MQAHPTMCVNTQDNLRAQQCHAQHHRSLWQKSEKCHLPGKAKEHQKTTGTHMHRQFCQALSFWRECQAKTDYATHPAQALSSTCIAAICETFIAQLPKPLSQPSSSSRPGRIRGALIFLVGGGKGRRFPNESNMGLYSSGTCSCMTGLFL